MKDKREFPSVFPLFSLLLGGLCLVGCVREPQFPAVPVCEQGIFQGIFVLNEGLLGTNTASIDVWDEDGNTRCEDITRARLSGPLGDVAQSFFRDADTLFLVLNSSRQVQKWQLPQMNLLATLQLAAPISPRTMVRMGPHKAYLTTLYGSDSLLVFDPVRMVLTGKVRAARFQEGMVCVGETAFVAVDAFPDRPDQRIALIHTPTDSLLGFVSLPIRNPGQLIAWRGSVWVQCIGDYNPAGQGSAVVELSAETGAVQRSFRFTGSVFGLEPAGDQLLVLRDSTLALVNAATGAVTEAWATRRALTGSSTDILYGLYYDAEKSLLYVCNARDYVTPGEIVVLNPLGEVVARMPAGNLPKKVFAVR